MITALLVTCLPVCRALGKYSQVAGESVHSSHCKLLPVSRFCRLQAFGLKSHLPGDCLSNQGRGITVGTAHIIKNPAWRSRNGVRGLEADVGGVTGCSSTSRHNPLKWILREWPVVRAEGRIDPAQLSANTTRQGRSYFVEFRLELRRLHHRLGGSATSHISEGSSRVQGCGDSR